MEWVETTGSVDEAKNVALDQLGVDESDAEFEIVEEPAPACSGASGVRRGCGRGFAPLLRAEVGPPGPPTAQGRRRQAATAATAHRRRRSGRGATRTRAPAPRPPARGRGEPMDERTSDGEEPTSEQVAEDAAEFLRGLLDAFGLDGDVAPPSPPTARSRWPSAARTSGCSSAQGRRRCWPSRT